MAEKRVHLEKREDGKNHFSGTWAGKGKHTGKHDALKPDSPCGPGAAAGEKLNHMGLLCGPPDLVNTQPE